MGHPEKQVFLLGVGVGVGMEGWGSPDSAWVLLLLCAHDHSWSCSGDHRWYWDWTWVSMCKVGTFLAELSPTPDILVQVLRNHFGSCLAVNRYQKQDSSSHVPIMEHQKTGMSWYMVLFPNQGLYPLLESLHSSPLEARGIIALPCPESEWLCGCVVYRYGWGRQRR